MGSWFICMYLLCVYKPLTFGVTLSCNALYLPSSSLFIYSESLLEMYTIETP